MYACPCCGYRTLPKSPPGSGELCPVCFWEDVYPFSEEWTYNRQSLRSAQRKFLAVGASHEDWLDIVRAPTEEETRDPNWQTLDQQETDIRAELIRNIRSAFAHVQRGDGITLHQARVIDDYGGEAAQQVARTKDVDVHWWDVPDQWIETLGDVLSFLDPTGFRYYIPAYMVWTIEHYQTSHSLTVDFTIYALGLHKDRNEYKLRNFELMDEAQSQAICRFLRYLVKFGGFDADGSAAQNALDKYWGQFCSAQS